VRFYLLAFVSALFFCEIKHGAEAGKVRKAKYTKQNTKQSKLQNKANNTKQLADMLCYCWLLLRYDRSEFRSCMFIILLVLVFTFLRAGSSMLSPTSTFCEQVDEFNAVIRDSSNNANYLRPAESTGTGNMVKWP
jgi:hypothetical protein